MLKYLRMGNKRIKFIWWILVVVTVLTFVGGFIFLFGSGFDTGRQAQIAGAIGMVEGERISRTDLQNAVAEQRELFRRRYNNEPGDADSRMIESQAWRNLVVQRLMARRAKDLGLQAHDKEVLITLQTSPPAALTSLPDFQTNGRFDPAKFGQALRNPNINWAPFEQMVRDQLPTRKLQERMVASLKLSQPELQEAYRDRYQKLAVTLVQIPPAPDSLAPAPAPADLDRVYQKYLGRFDAPASVQLELVSLPKRFSEEELRIAREQAQDLTNRARKGEDFRQLVRDYSDDPGVENGEINRLLQPSDFGPELAPRMATMQKGDVSDPIAGSGRFMIVKVLDRIADPVSPIPNLRIARIVLKVKPTESTLKAQFDELRKLRDRARSMGLSRAATEKGLSTGRTGFFGYGDSPSQLSDVPDLAEWAFGQKVGALSTVVEGTDAFYLAQVAQVRPAGPAPKEEVAELLRSLAKSEARVMAAKPRADRLVSDVARGQTLEQAAKAQGLATVKVASMSRAEPDAHFSATPEAVGTIFATRVGAMAGPIQTLSGWFAVRVDAQVPDTTSYDRIKGDITTQILQRRQNEFMQAWVAGQRTGAKIQDLRTP